MSDCVRDPACKAILDGKAEQALPDKVSNLITRMTVEIPASPLESTRDFHQLLVVMLNVSRTEKDGVVDGRPAEIRVRQSGPRILALRL